MLPSILMETFTPGEVEKLHNSTRASADMGPLSSKKGLKGSMLFLTRGLKKLVVEHSIH